MERLYCMVESVECTCYKHSHMNGDQFDTLVEMQSILDSRAVFLPLWDLFHGQQPPCRHIDG